MQERRHHGTIVKKYHYQSYHIPMFWSCGVLRVCAQESICIRVDCHRTMWWQRTNVGAIYCITLTTKYCLNWNQLKFLHIWIFRIVSDTREWKHFKKLTQTVTSKLQSQHPPTPHPVFANVRKERRHWHETFMVIVVVFRYRRRYV